MCESRSGRDRRQFVFLRPPPGGGPGGGEAPNPFEPHVCHLRTGNLSRNRIEWDLCEECPAHGVTSARPAGRCCGGRERQSLVRNMSHLVMPVATGIAWCHGFGGKMTLNKATYGDVTGESLAVSIQASTKYPCTRVVLACVESLRCRRLASGWTVTSGRADSGRAALP